MLTFKFLQNHTTICSTVWECMYAFLHCVGRQNVLFMRGGCFFVIVDSLVCGEPISFYDYFIDSMAVKGFWADIIMT